MEEVEDVNLGVWKTLLFGMPLEESCVKLREKGRLSSTASIPSHMISSLQQLETLTEEVSICMYEILFSSLECSTVQTNSEAVDEDIVLILLNLTEPGRHEYSFSLTAEAVFLSTTLTKHCLLYTSPSPRDRQKSRMPSSA